MDEHLPPQGKSAIKMSKVTVAIALLAVSVIFVLCHSALAVQFNSGETYTFTTPSPPSGQVYTYLWSASDGSSTEYTNRIFNWTAPLVDAPKNVTINVTVTASRGCRAGHEMELTVIPKPIGQFIIEESLDGSQNNVLLGSTISYTIDITNTGQTNIAYLPLRNDYPEKFLKPVSSDPAWNEDNGSSLSWDNLLSAPLAPGQSVKVSVRFRVIDITNLAVINTVRAEGAKNGDGSILGPQKTGYTIAAIGYECPTLGPDTACIGEEVTFSGIPGLQSYRWAANDSNGHSVGGFNDSTKADVKWTPPGRGVFEISFNNGLCKQLVTVKQCKFGQISLEKSLDSSPDGVKLGAVVSYTINITNTGQTNVTFLPLSDNYPNALLKPVSSNPQWSNDNGSSLIWSNLLNAPLAPGHSIQVSTSFQVINVTDQPVSNLARVQSAKDDIGAALPTQEASNTINGIKFECQKLGPDTACTGVVVPFSAHLVLPSYQWKALDSQGNSVGGFDDPTKPDVKWTPPGPGTFEISFNNLVCKQTIIVNQCNSGIQVEMLFDGDKNNVRLGDTVGYTINITNTGQTNVTFLPLSDNYPKEFLKPVSSNPTWTGDSGSTLSWNNLLVAPLAPGRSIQVSTSFQVINVTDQPVSNMARVQSAKNDIGAALSTQEASSTINGVKYDSSIQIKKNCDYKSPVRVGDTVTYIYDVTNTGKLPLKDVKVTDVPDWGPGCTPKYVGGDNGNNILEPSETWRYECKYKIPDPLDYKRLTIMSSQSESSQQEMIIQKLMNSRTRLEIMLKNLKQLRSGFNKTLAQKTVGNIEIQGVKYIRYNYTSKLVGEALIETLDRTGAIKSSIYIDPISESTLFTRYGNHSIPISDDFNSDMTRESLNIEYDKPSKGYITYTIIDHSNGNSLIILILDSSGTILSKQYKKTPGAMIYKTTLGNTANVTAIDTIIGSTVSDSVYYNKFDIERPLPELSIAKKAEPDPVQAGKTLTYSISYRNLGNETAHSVVINENYDKNVTFASSSPLPDAGSNNIWNLGDIAKGVSGAITVNVKVNPSVQNGSLLKNIAEISCAENIKANASINTTVLELLPLLQINKTASQGLISNSTEFYYIITYKNIGQINATNVSIDDIVDKNNLKVQKIELKPSMINLSTNILYRWNLTLLRPGASGTIVMHMQAKDSLPKSLKNVYNLYRISSNETQGAYNVLETIVLHSLYVRKIVGRKSYSPGELVNYTIFYGNTEPHPLDAHNVIITDNLPDVELVEASPTPNAVQGKNLVWNIGTLPASSNRSISLTVRVRERPNIKFDESGSVSGDGYIYDRKKLSTNIEPYGLTNFVKITGDYQDGPDKHSESDSDSVSVTVADPGTEIETVEHGSGYYQQEQHVSYNNSNKSIRLDKKIFAKHAPTSLSLSRNRGINFNSLWFDRTRAINNVRNETVSENYLYMNLINKESHFLVDPNQTTYKSTGDFFGGKAQISYIKSEPHTVPGSAKADVEISEDYHGSFKIGQSLDSYGDGVSYSKSANGLGFVASDKRIGKTQRSFETGSGGYQSDEVIKTGVVYKDSNMTYAPNNQWFGSFKASYSSKWHEEMRTSNRDIGATVSERIGFADKIKKETLMQDAVMSLLAQFNGTADIKAVQQIGPKVKENLRIDQTFTGNYKLDTTIAINEGPKYIRPHINVTKKVLKQDDYTALFRINLTNDGNKTLGPIYVTDRLPEGLTFINSSLRPDTTGREIRWSLPSLQIGGKQSITLRASLKDTRSQFINLVDVSAQYNGGVVTASAACGFVLDWLPCCLTEKPALRPHLNASNYSNYAAYFGGGWVPPKSFNLGLNLSEYPLDQEIPCSSCLLNAPENDGCDTCP